MFERLAHLWWTLWAHNSNSRDLIPALLSFARILTTGLFCPGWAVCPPGEGGAVSVLATKLCPRTCTGHLISKYLSNESKKEYMVSPLHTLLWEMAGV